MAALLPAITASARTLPAGADDLHLWVVRPDSEGSGPSPRSVLFHGILDPGATTDALRLTKVTALRGEVAMRELPARQRTVIIPFRDGALRRFWVEPGTLPGDWDLDSALLANLPDAASLRALTAGDDAPVWALVRQEHAATIAAAPKPTRPGTGVSPTLERILDLPPGAMAGPPATGAEDQPEAAPSSDTPPDRPTDVLLQRDGSRWTPVPLPDGWPVGQPAWLVGQEGLPRPMLVTVAPDRGEGIWRYRWSVDDDAEAEAEVGSWTRDAVQLGDANRRLVAALDVAGQTVLVMQPTAPQERVTISAAVWRQDRLVPLGDLALDVPAGTPWNVVAIGGELALLALPPDQAERLVWTRLTLQGGVREQADVDLVTPNPLAETPGVVLQTGVLVLVLALVVLFWRRDAGVQLLELPRGVMLADLSRRTVAGMIDLAPGLAAVMLGWGYDFELMYHHWPTSQGPGMTWPGMLPGVIVVVIFVAHTTLTETLTGRSLGKWLLKLRVTNLAGQPATKAQLVSRSLLKVFDAIAWLPLVLPLIGPYRQRLGDIVARTVVVTGTPQTDGQKNKESA